MPTGVYERPLRLCGIENCNNKHFAKGLCKKCYDKQYNEQYCKGHKTERKQYLKDNKKHPAIRAKLYQKDNKEYLLGYRKKYWQTPAGKAVAKAHKHNRRTLEKGLTKEVVQRVYEDNIKKYGTLTCVLCFKPVEFADSSLEHLTPLSRGGTNLYENLGVAHLNCNIRKGAMTLEEWVNKKVSNSIISTSPALETKTKR